MTEIEWYGLRLYHGIVGKPLERLITPAEIPLYVEAGTPKEQIIEMLKELIETLVEAEATQWLNI